MHRFEEGTVIRADGRTRSVWSGGGRSAVALLLAALLAAAAPAGAQMEALETTIDLNYIYQQDHAGDDVVARTGLQQKYQLKLSTTLTSSLDFLGAISVDLEDRWETDAATTSRVAPSLELGVKGPQSAARFSYSGVVSTTDEDEYEGTPESKQYSNSAVVDLELTPDYWPELKFSLQEQRDYEEEVTETSSRIIELQLRDDFYDVRWEFLLQVSKEIGEMEDTLDDTTDWSWKATYKEEILGGADFEVAYEIRESYSESTTRDIFREQSEEYVQTLKARLRKQLDLTPRLHTTLTWEYNFDQDLLELEYDHKVQTRYELDARYDVTPSLKVTGNAKRETERESAVAGVDDTGKVNDTLKAAFDFEPSKWLRFGGKTEWNFEESLEEDSGASIDHADDRQYELSVKNRFGEAWDLTASVSNSWSYTDGQIDDREAKFKADLRLRLLRLDWADMNVQPSYETSRKTGWDGPGDPTEESLTTDARIKIEAKAELLRDLLKLTFSHEYGRKILEETDAVLNFDREVAYNETTRLNIALTDLFEGLKLEGEVERKGDDTEDDPEPEVVEISYALKLDWTYEELSLASGFRYNDRDEDDDDLEFTAKIGWKGERVDVSGDYQFTKTYADLTEEGRSLNLKLSYKF